MNDYWAGYLSALVTMVCVIAIIMAMGGHIAWQ